MKELKNHCQAKNESFAEVVSPFIISVTGGLYLYKT